MQHAMFTELVVVLCAALITTVLFQRMRLPTILAYLLAGCLVGPQLLGWVRNPGDFAFLAEFGVVFLMFSLGLEFSLPRLLALRSSVFGVGSVQVLVCTGVFALAVFAWGSSPAAAVLIAGALALSSTAIVSKELSTLGQLGSRHGQLAFGVLLFQDLAAVVFLILVPVLAGGGEASFVQELGAALGRGLLLLGLLLAVGKWVLPRLYLEVARARSEEIFVLTTLVIALLAALLTHQFELSMALGGFVIGMMLGEGPFRHQIENDIRSFKDILLGLFFVTIGMSIDVGLLVSFWPRIIAFTVALVLIKTVVIALVVNVLGEDRPTSLQTGLNLAQAGEFGLALLALAQIHGVVPAEQGSFIMLVAVFSMAISPFMVRYSLPLSRALLGRLGLGKPVAESTAPVVLHHQGHVVIGGFGRMGQTIARFLGANGVPYIAIEHDIDLLSQQRQAGANIIYGDCGKAEILRSCHIESARLAILTFKSQERARDAIRQIRAEGIEVPIIARCFSPDNLTELLDLGANWVVPEMLEASLAISGEVLLHLGIARDEIEVQLDRERRRVLPPLKGSQA